MCFARKLATLTIKLQNINHQYINFHFLSKSALQWRPQMGKAHKRLIKDLDQCTRCIFNAQEAQERLRWADSLGVDCRTIVARKTMFRFSILLDQHSLKTYLYNVKCTFGNCAPGKAQESLWRGDWSARILSQRALIALGKHLYRHKTVLNQRFNVLIFFITACPYCPYRKGMQVCCCIHQTWLSQRFSGF